MASIGGVASALIPRRRVDPFMCVLVGLSITLFITAIATETDRYQQSLDRGSPLTVPEVVLKVLVQNEDDLALAIQHQQALGLSVISISRDPKGTFEVSFGRSGSDRKSPLKEGKKENIQ